jgi:hypothetical protein
MWLHDHPRNRERERRGELPVNGLWLWGGAGAELPPSAMATVPLSHAFGADPFLHGLWRALGATVREVSRFTELPAEISAAIVVQSAAAQSLRDQPMHRLEADWFAPVVEALARGELRTLRLWLGGRGWEIAPTRLFGMNLQRPLRRRKSLRWWQHVTA